MLLVTPQLKSYTRDLELARVVDGVNQGDETACEGQTQLHGGKGHQHDETANGNVPDAHGVLLEGEEAGYATSSMKDSSGRVKGSDAVLNVKHIFPACR